MIVGLCNKMATAWFDEFSTSCEALGLEKRTINIGADDWMKQLKGVEIFVWRLTMGDASCMAEARTKIPLIEAMGIRCFPNQKMLWLYDDKIRETFFLQQNDYPTPRTWVFFDMDAAWEFVAQASYPLVAKSHCGAGAKGVQLLQSPAEARNLLERIFRGVSLIDKVLAKYFYIPRMAKGDILGMLNSRYRNSRPRYAYFQEFLHIDRDWRVTTMGKDIVSLFTRKNRPEDFRASGSGLWEQVGEKSLPTEAFDLALSISNKHQFTSMTYDFLKDGDRWVIGELSYAFVLDQYYAEQAFIRDKGTYSRGNFHSIGELHLRAVMEQMLEVGDARQK